MRKGFYCEIFVKYFELFPESTLLLIDNQYAVNEMQKLNEFLAEALNWTNIYMWENKPNMHRNKGPGCDEELTENNLKRLNQFYSKHKQSLIQILP